MDLAFLHGFPRAKRSGARRTTTSAVPRKRGNSTELVREIHRAYSSFDARGANPTLLHAISTASSELPRTSTISSGLLQALSVPASSSAPVAAWWSSLTCTIPPRTPLRAFTVQQGDNAGELAERFSGLSSVCLCTGALPCGPPLSCREIVISEPSGRPPKWTSVTILQPKSVRPDVKRWGWPGPAGSSARMAGSTDASRASRFPGAVARAP
jgi:hypothetical protein